MDGQIIGTWKRTMKKELVMVTPSFFIEMDADKRRAFDTALERYGVFLSRTTNITYQVV